MEAFGITSLILAVVGIFIPIIGYFLSGISGIFAFFSAKKKAAFGISAAIINIINLYLLSPSLTLPIALAKKKIKGHHAHVQENIFIILLLIQIVAIIYIAVIRYRQKKEERA